MKVRLALKSAIVAAFVCTLVTGGAFALGIEPYPSDAPPTAKPLAAPTVSPGDKPPVPSRDGAKIRFKAATFDPLVRNDAGGMDIQHDARGVAHCTL